MPRFYTMLPYAQHESNVLAEKFQAMVRIA